MNTVSAHEINPVTYCRRLTEPGFEPQSCHCLGKYCNCMATRADYIRGLKVVKSIMLH